MTYPVDVSELSVLVGSLELVVSALVITHPDKPALAARLAEVARSIHAAKSGAAPLRERRVAGDYDIVMSFVRLARDAIDREYDRER